MNDIKIGCGVKGVYKMQVLENGKVVEDRPWAENMILNQGLDYALSGSCDTVAKLFRYHCVGTSNIAVAATQTGLGNEVKRTGTLIKGVGNVGRTTTGNTATFRYTWDHSPEGIGGANYSEHGISPSETPGNNLFARSLISGGTISVAEGQQLRVIYDVSVTVTPSTQTAATVGGTGWPVSGVTDCTGLAIISAWDTAVGYLSSTDGGSGGNSFLNFANPNGYGCAMHACSAITLNSSIDGSLSTSRIGGSEIILYPGTYTNGSFTRNYVPSDYATAASWSSTSIYGWLFLSNYYARDALCFKYTYAQTKASTHRLRYPSITVTWARA